MTDEELDHAPITKGTKHRDRTPSTIAQLDPFWLVWAYENWNPKPCSKLLYEDCKAEVDEARRQHRVSKDQESDHE